MKRNVSALLMALLLALSLAACGGGGGEVPPQDAQPDVTAPVVTPAPPEASPAQPDATPAPPSGGAAPDEGAGQPMDADFGAEDGFSYSVEAAEALYDLQDHLTREPFAVAYLGCREKGDTTALAGWMHDTVPVLAATMPFVTEIPAQYTFGSYGDLYCIVPRGSDTALSVNRVAWEDAGNGAWPSVTDALYESDHAEPVLVFVTHGAWRDETDVVIRATAADGEGIEWYPLVDLETGGCTVPVDVDGVPFIFDFSHLYDVGDYTPDAEWLPPTDLGLANTTWLTESGWLVELGYDENAMNGSGGAVVYRSVEDGQGGYLERDCHGIWQMEGDNLYLELYAADGRMTGGRFPVLISPSGEQLYITQAADGALPPFFAKGETCTTLTLSYG